MEIAGRKNLRRLVILIAILAGIIIVWVVAGSYFASSMEKKAEENWEKHFPSIEALRKQFPKISTNESGLILISLSAKLGIDLTPYQESGRKQLSLVEMDQYEKAMLGLYQYLQQQLERNDDILFPPPQEISIYLISHDTDIEEIVSHVLNNETPLWDADFMSAKDSYLAYKGFIQLQRVLIASALEKIRAENNEKALNLLETSWIINLSFQERPESVLYLIAISIRKMQEGVLRKLQYIPSIWNKRLNINDYKEIFFNSYVVEAWQVMHLRALPELSFYQNNSLLRLFFKPLLNPYVRLCMADNFLKLSNALAKIKDSDYCLLDIEDVALDYNESLASWNKMGRHVIPYLTIWDRVRMINLSTEFTQKITHVKQLKILSDNGKWPDKITGTESSICKDLQWIYNVDSDGLMCLSLSGKPFWYKPEYPKAFLLPLRYCSR